MQRMSFVIVLLCAGALAADDQAASTHDDKAKESAGAVGPKRAADKLLSAGTLVGDIIRLADDAIKLRVTCTALLVNEGVAQRIAGLQGELLSSQTQLVQAIANRDIDGVAGARRDMARVQSEIVANASRLYYRDKRETSIDIPLPDGVAVRRRQLPVPFDNKGRPRKYAPEELKELKGAVNLPGFQADRFDLEVKQRVFVYLVRKRGAAPMASVVVILIDPDP